MLDRLEEKWPGRFTLEAAEWEGDGDVIRLLGDCCFDYYLAVSYDCALVGISLNWSMPAGGDVTVADWLVTSDDVFEQVIEGVRGLRPEFRCSRCADA